MDFVMDLASLSSSNKGWLGSPPTSHGGWYLGKFTALNGRFSSHVGFTRSQQLGQCWVLRWKTFQSNSGSWPHYILLFGILFLGGKSRSAKETCPLQRDQILHGNLASAKTDENLSWNMATTIAPVQANKWRQSHSESSHHPTNRCMWSSWRAIWRVYCIPLLDHL